MIHPNMATMLGYITTDAKISQQALQQALEKLRKNHLIKLRLMVILQQMIRYWLLANGKAENETLTPEHPEWQVFKHLLTLTSESLAKQIAQGWRRGNKTH